MWNSQVFPDISTRLIHMPKACPYKLTDEITIYKKEMHRNFGMHYIIGMDGQWRIRQGEG